MRERVRLSSASSSEEEEENDAEEEEDETSGRTMSMRTTTRPRRHEGHRGGPLLQPGGQAEFVAEDEAAIVWGPSPELGPDSDEDESDESDDGWAGSEDEEWEDGEVLRLLDDEPKKKKKSITKTSEGHLALSKII